MNNKYSQQGVVDMVLTSIVNNKEILRCVTKDISDRFKINLDKNKLESFLSVVDVKVNDNPILM
jgi:hypothetical protein